jgi:hypothetical protein
MFSEAVNLYASIMPFSKKSCCLTLLAGSEFKDFLYFLFAARTIVIKGKEKKEKKLVSVRS